MNTYIYIYIYIYIGVYIIKLSNFNMYDRYVKYNFIIFCNYVYN